MSFVDGRHDDETDAKAHLIFFFAVVAISTTIKNTFGCCIYLRARAHVFFPQSHRADDDFLVQLLSQG